MRLPRRVRAILSTLFRRERLDQDLDAEMQGFYETMVDRYVEQGLPVEEARRKARLEFGGAEQVKEEVRDVRAGFALSALLRDVNYAFRTMRRTPVFALVTILTLALGIGANATIFSIVSRFLLRHPPVGDPATLMSLHTTYAKGRCCNNFTWPLFSDLREQAHSFSGLTAYYDLFPASIGGAGDPERVWGQAVTANFFDVAQLPMVSGRGFMPEEENRSVVVLGYGLWQRRFGGDREIAGKTVQLSGHPFTVVGVTPQGFRGLDIILNSAFWIPLGTLDQLLPNTANRTSRDDHWIAVAGRLRPGVGPRQAEAELAVLAQRFGAAHAEEKDGGFRMQPAGSLPPRDRTALLMFLGGISAVAILVLCIACANVANLSLAQASGRRREMAVRLALGATARHLLRQMLTESVLLALGGGILGVALSLAATYGLTTFRLPAPVPLDLSIDVDWRVLLYAFALSVGAGILFGLVPAWTAGRPIIASALKGDDMLAAPGRFWSLRNVLAIAQIAMSLVLLCATGLFLRSLRNATNIDIGFRSRGVLMMSIDPRLHGYTADRAVQLLDTLRRRVAAIPGVLSVACADSMPLSGGHRSDGFAVEGKTAEKGQNSIVDMYMATHGYLDTLGIPRIAGRDLAEDAATATRVALVNEVFAQHYFPGENAVGRHVRDGKRIYEIVGVTGNIKSRTLGEDLRPVLFRSLAQELKDDPSTVGYTVIARYTGDAGAMSYAIRREIHALDPSLAIFNAETMEEHLRDALFLPRLTGLLFGAFGFLGLSLAAVGLYGVMSYWVSRRTREIGIRLAIGARISEVQRLVIRQGMAITAIGIVPGLIAAWILAKLFNSLLYGIAAHDTATFVMVPLFLTAVALLACWIPSRRASKVDPSITLRHE